MGIEIKLLSVPKVPAGINSSIMNMEIISIWKSYRIYTGKYFAPMGIEIVSAGTGKICISGYKWHEN